MIKTITFCPCYLLFSDDSGGLSGGAIAGIVVGCLIGVTAIFFIIIQSDQRKKRQLAASWARTKQRAHNARQAAGRKAVALKTAVKEANARRAARRAAAARESAARKSAAREAAAREATEREEAAMREASRTGPASVEVHAVIESDLCQPQVFYAQL